MRVLVSGPGNAENPPTTARQASSSQHHFVAMFTVTLLWEGFEVSCGETVWTEAVFPICWATADAVTVSVIVA